LTTCIQLPLLCIEFLYNRGYVIMIVIFEIK